MSLNKDFEGLDISYIYSSNERKIIAQDYERIKEYLFNIEI